MRTCFTACLFIVVLLLSIALAAEKMKTARQESFTIYLQKCVVDLTKKLRRAEGEEEHTKAYVLTVFEQQSEPRCR